MGSLMAGSLLGSVPVALIYSFFVEYYVSSMTAAVKVEKRSAFRRRSSGGRPRAFHQTRRRGTARLAALPPSCLKAAYHRLSEGT